MPVQSDMYNEFQQHINYKYFDPHVMFSSLMAHGYCITQLYFLTRQHHMLLLIRRINGRSLGDFRKFIFVLEIREDSFEKYFQFILVFKWLMCSVFVVRIAEFSRFCKQNGAPCICSRPTTNYFGFDEW